MWWFGSANCGISHTHSYTHSCHFAGMLAYFSQWNGSPYPVSKSWTQQTPVTSQPKPVSKVHLSCTPLLPGWELHDNAAASLNLCCCFHMQQCTRHCYRKQARWMSARLCSINFCKQCMFGHDVQSCCLCSSRCLCCKHDACFGN